MEFYNMYGERLRCSYDASGIPVLSNKIRLVSLNIESFSPRNVYALNHILANYKPDFIQMQEAIGSENSFELYLPKYAKYFGQQSSWRTGVASYFGVLENNFKAYDVNSTEGKRGYQKTILNVCGKRVILVNTHLETQEYVRGKQAEELFNLVKDEEYFIISGDLNVACKSITDADYISVIKPFVDIGCNLANCTEETGFINTWTSSTTDMTEGYPTDNIITSGNITFDELIFDYHKLSYGGDTEIDHIPIFAVLSVN